MKKISIIIPAHNEELNIPIIYKEIFKALSTLSDKYDYEIVFVNDGSFDKTGEAINIIIEDDKRVKYLEFSRNFGKEMAITAGLNNCAGDCAIIMDADLQHPPTMIPNFIADWKKGFEVVVGIRKKSKSDSWIKVLGSKLFYRIMSRISETDIAPNSTDFRLIDRKVIDAFNLCTERTRIARGLIAWLGFKKSFIEFEAGERSNGKASYNTLKLFKLALSSFVSMSLFPLKVAGYLGVFITLFAGILGVFIFLAKFVFNNFLGFTWLAALTVINIFLIGIVLSCLGLIALYIASIHEEVLNRPLYVIREKK